MLSEPVVNRPIRRNPFLTLGAASLILTACEQRQAAERTAAPIRATDTAMTVALPPAQPTPPDTTDVSRTHLGYFSGRDTTFHLGKQRYRLLLRAETDSTKPLTAESEGITGGAFAEDTSTFATTRRVRGYEGGQVITLLDSVGRRVFQRRLRKAEFYGVAGRDIVTVSEPNRPKFIGGHTPSQTLAFTLDIGIPYSDVWQKCVLVLGLDGRVRRIVNSYESNWDSPDCEPRMLPNGTVLTCQGLVQPTGRLISLRKPKAQIVAAFMLTDSTLLVVHRYGEYQPRARNTEAEAADMPVSAGFGETDWVEDPRMRSAPNSFVINTEGKVLNKFRFDGTGGVMFNQVPRHYAWQLHSYYLLDEKRGLYWLDKHNPTALQEIPFRQMERFRLPQRPAETRFMIESEVSSVSYVFYLDPAQPTKLRYQRIKRTE
ncbi:hypothetical protein HMJ29_07235 [Hymenobacter taeanensis]|uniref:Uncharacterized protein n=1 Tax=Hymenobacter taeanensis TaxID=2735321 RepID=A0A6M6BFL1_9BACT|nr:MULTISPECIES: hypothetical protein [Hymenobacter]QJX46742.1 hypothetical protein HMJ29_07235 [Hymenobacter taeanensis]UOQ80611.1 hypothetical protein MUN83_17580 [Hymenobacter sp. 5414T-23]